MNPRARLLLLALLLLPLLAACGGEDAASPGRAVEVAGATPASSLALAQDLPDAIPVLEAMGGQEGQDVAVVGRLQSKVKGRAIFHIVDDSVPDCLRCGMKDACKTPWDYCCKEKEMKAASMLVEMRGADGQPLRIAGPGLRELDLVALKGRLTKGADGRLMLLASGGWFVRERPEVSRRVKFPD
jgi:hypothetical protein